MKAIILILLLLTLLESSGPKRVATFDRNLWPYKIDSLQAFDKASRHEILHYVIALDGSDIDDEIAVKSLTGLKRVELSSVHRWRLFIENYLLNNFKKAQGSCINKLGLCSPVQSWQELLSLFYNYNLEKELQPWAKASQKFVLYYLYEQVRLAALFPRITSEIDKLHDNESQGFEFNDREFLLSFDDGPKFTLTQKLIQKMNTYNISGYFFVLGENLKKNLDRYGDIKIKELYQTQCVGSHGFIHKPHPKLSNWKELYGKTRQLITGNKLQGYSKDEIWFRPPYGQRHDKLIAHLNQLKDRVMLWNIDSQDWNRKLSAKEVEDRLLTLMLLHRKGIVLFHDIHTKAVASIEKLSLLEKNGSVKWLNCHEVKP